MVLVPYNPDNAISERPEYTPPNIDENDTSVLGAAFRQENDVYAMTQLAGREVFEPDAAFDFKTAASESAVFAAFPDAFTAARSEAEFRWLEQKVGEEAADRATLSSAGFAGIAAGMAAGMLSPTILLPGGAIGRGATALKAGASVGAWAAVGVAAQETILQREQQLRTPGETALAIGTGAVLGGLLGAGIQQLTKGQFDKIAAGMVDGTIPEAIQPSAGPSSMGAAATPEELRFEANAGGIAPAFGVDKAFQWLNPVTRNLSQKYSSTVKWAQAQLDTGGISLERNAEGIASNSGGDVITLAKQWDTAVANSRGFEKALFKEYRGENGQLSLKEFQVEVGRALERGDVADDPFIARAAKHYRETTFLPILREAQRLGMPGFSDITDEFASKYISRIVKKELAKRDYDDFVQVLKENSEEKLVGQWQRKQDSVYGRAESLEEQASDLGLDAEGEATVRAELETNMAALPQDFPEVTDVAEEIRALRAAATAEPDGAIKVALRVQAEQLQKANKVALKDFSRAERKLKNRFRNLNNSMAGLEREHQRLIGRIDTIEGQQLDTLARANKTAHRLLSRIDSLSDEALEAELKKLETQFNQALGVYERGQARLVKLNEVPEDFRHLVDDDVRPTDRISTEERHQQQRAERAEAILTKLGDAEDNRLLAREAVNDALEELNGRTNKVNTKRALRSESLRVRATKADPAVAAGRSVELNARAADLRANFAQQAQEAGDASKTAGQFDFASQADTNAREVADSMLAQGNRHPYFSLLNERGPELARTLDIDPLRKWSNGRSYEEFLERDVEKIQRRYVRTMGSDIEIFRKFGTLQPLGPDSPVLARIKEDFSQAKVDAAKEFKGKRLAKERDKIVRAEFEAVRDLQAVVDRIRHVRGLPEDPSSIPYRAGRIALNLNTMRMMGTVVPSSLADVARPIMKHGLVRTFRDGYLPLITNLKGFTASAQEVKQAGTALDLALHGRAAAVFDIFDEVEYGTAAERGLQYATNNFGLIALFDYWNSGMKQLTGVVTQARIQDSLELVVNGGSQRRVAEATRFLAASGIDGDSARIMLAEMQGAGGTRVKGVLLPNTAEWGQEALRKGDQAAYQRGADARRAYRAALARSVDDTIVTPGTERPLMVDANMMARLLFQFRSFTLSSTTKIMMAGAQDARAGNMAPVVGATFSLALGTLSYYTWAMSRGGKAKEDMLNADIDKWADEAITRSGLLGVFGELHRVAERTPGLEDYITFSGAPTTRSPFVTPIGDSLGPTFGGLVETADNLLTTAHDPNSSTFNSLRRLTPYNNVWWMSRGFTKVNDYLKEQAGVN